MAATGTTQMPRGELAEMELEAAHDVGQVAKLHAERLPEQSEWRKLLADLAESLEGDAAAMQTVGPFGGDS
jgi:hypothetical protein